MKRSIKPTAVNNISSTSTVTPVYTIKGKKPTAACAELIKAPVKHIQLTINNVKIEVADNVKDINVTPAGISILFK